MTKTEQKYVAAALTELVIGVSGGIACADIASKAMKILPLKKGLLYSVGRGALLLGAFKAGCDFACKENNWLVESLFGVKNDENPIEEASEEHSEETVKDSTESNTTFYDDDHEDILGE